MLSKEDAIGLEHVSDETFHDIRTRASQVRDSHWGKTVTYSKKVFIPLTNMCRDTCGYCTFVKHPSSPEAKLMSREEVMDIVLEGERLGCKEVLFSLGEKPEKKFKEAKNALKKLGFETMIDYVQSMCEEVIDRTSLLPHVNAGTLSEADILKLKPVTASMGMMLESVSTRLLKKGQAHFGCPDKLPKVRLQTLELAGQHNVPFTTGILIGIGETWAERIESLISINEMHKKYGHIQEVIVQNFKAKSGTAMADFPEPSCQDMLMTLAVARLILSPSISLQAPPNLQDRFKSYIQSGINDWGGISPLTIDHINPERAWPKIKAIDMVTSECGYALSERLAIYPEYKKKLDQYVSPLIHHQILDLEKNAGKELSPDYTRSVAI
ncbi:7,8-didemethyl-8-hydroxy-5-deazariboflavin synthase CofG [Vibrio sp. S9_S30]|uniref:7,8-didemethyl-8-hydroxy-5-deazariboflavin synthase CofG n=1 Tax=Vibrio sp. S9_S30 TaxID=2720226 RepID=UPI0016806697|nr:7,8-didemethyl-8-hydroxy-5-deazariboflavin synthase CofG [Vibrio sp. S9_S30]MBD1558585.1 7,8-didemethyl-8-hydroxy-5-deazariboflavin synthase CofG [Vibrio sp. S9_S30]